MRVKPALALAGCFVAGCASVARPPGGPEDHAPPEIVSISIDTNATMVKAASISIQFDEVIAERPIIAGGGAQGTPTLDGVVLMSPQTGETGVRWKRDRIDIEPRGGFRPNTAYHITILPGISDIRGNVRHEETSLVFTTGPALPPYSILGRVFDWAANAPAPMAVVEAVANAGTKDSLVYIAVADSSGQFDLGPMAAGTFLVRGFIDSDNNRAIGTLEKWDTLTVAVTDHRPVIELRAIQRDTASPGIQRVDVIDSAYLRLTLDKPYDPAQTLQPALIVLKHADSTEVTIAAAMTEARAAMERPRVDSARDTTRRPTPALPSTTSAVSTRPPAPKPAAPPPERVIVVHLAPPAVLKPDEHYVITVRGIRNLIGHAGAASFEFTVPKPAPPPATKPPPANR